MKKIFSLFAAVLFAGSMMAADVLSTDFTAGQGSWTINDVELDGISYVWQQSSSYGMKASAYVSGANHATESWLVSPAFDLSEATEATLAISHVRRYGDVSHLSVKATADGENWSALTVSAWSDGSNWTFIDATADLSEFAGEESVKIAFVYTSTSSAAGTWEIKTAKVTTDGEGGQGGETVDTYTLEQLAQIGDELTDITVTFADQEIVDFYASSQQVRKGIFFDIKGVNDKNIELYYSSGSVAVPDTWVVGGKVSGTVTGNWTYYSAKEQWELVPTTANWTWANLTYAAPESGELTDPTNCAEAREAALSVSANNEEYNGGKEYTIEGFVTSIAYAWKDGSMSFWMADTKEGGNVLEAYKCAIEKEEDAVRVGDKVAVTGKLTKFNTTPEFAAGCTVEILERAAAPVNLGEKTIEEFLALKNTKDTCILTGVVKNIQNTTYGNFDLEDETGSVYVYGLLTAAGEAQKFAEMGIEENDTLTIKAVYNEYNGTPQAKNAVFVSVTKGEGGGDDTMHQYDTDEDYEMVFDSYTIDGENLADGYIYVEAQDEEGNYVILDITLPQGAEGLVAGEYAIDATYEYPYQTVTAGYYDAEQESVVASFAATLVEDEGQLYLDKIWYLVSGTVTVDEDLNIEVEALNSLGKQVNLLLAAPDETGVETTKVADKAVKFIENATLIIERSGVRYNVMGQVVR
ncbi:MAG: choice-of-anchor J domain-containing protein [Paludibacteraceae bacterium]|nr:choice-of-anchor J domain-containing protein [Paludibacteraceae bacterium]